MISPSASELRKHGELNLHHRADSQRMPAAHGDDDGAVQGDDVKRTFRAVFVVMVARWSSRWRVVVVEPAT
jgi:hypothetical protein